MKAAAGCRSRRVPGLVVGAGAAGLAAAAMLSDRGIEAVVLERGNQPGESWHHRYDALHLNSVRWMSSLPGYLMERRYGSFPSRTDWMAYLGRYANRKALSIEYGVEAQRIERDGSDWRTETTAGSIQAPFVVVATGMDHTPVVPPWSGREAFGGEVLHSADFRTAEPFRGQDVLVVGAGNSACEIAMLLARGGASAVRIAVRTPPLILPRRVLGLSITSWAIPARLLPDRLLDSMSRSVQRLAFGDLSVYGLPRSPRGVSAQRREGYVAPVDCGFVNAVKRGAVEVVGALEGFEGDEALLRGGRRVEPDAVIVATGYRTGLAPLVGHLGVLGRDERPRVHGGVAPPDADGLFFVGYHYDLIPTLPHVGTEARGVARTAAKGSTSQNRR